MAERSPSSGGDPPIALDRETLVVAGVALAGMFMALLDVTIVFVVLGPLALEFGVPFTTIQWVATAYTLALAAMFPFSGWAADRFGARRVYLAGLVVFVIGSALCATAWDAASLIGFRVVQGIGGGMVLPTVMTLVTRKAGPRRRGRVIGVLGVPLLFAPLIGPVLGGWLVDSVSWHLIFAVNVPLGILAIALALAFLDHDEPQPGQRLDWLGATLLSPGLTLLLFGLAESSHDGFGRPAAWLPALAGALLMAAFAVHSWRAEAPLIEVRRFARTYAGAAAATLMMVTTALFGALLLIPLYYQSVRGASTLESGLLLLPQGLGLMVTLPLAGWLTDHRGPRFLPLMGTVLLAVGLAPFALLTADTPYLVLIVFSFVLGMGDGLVFVPATTAALAMVPPRLISRTNTALSIVNESAASIGTALVSVLIANAAAAEGLGSVHGAPVTPAVAPQLSAAFAESFAWLIVLLAVAAVPALLLAGARLPHDT